MHLMADEQMVELMMQDPVALQSSMFISAEDVTQIMLRAMGDALLNIVQAGTITWVCTALAAALAIGLLIPTIAMTACRLRDAGSSQLWWLAVLPSYLIFGLQCIAPDSEWVTGQGYHILSLLSSIPFLLFFAMLCKPSKLGD